MCSTSWSAREGGSGGDQESSAFLASLHQGALLGTLIEKYLASHSYQTHTAGVEACKSLSTASELLARKGGQRGRHQHSQLSTRKGGSPARVTPRRRGHGEVDCRLHNFPVSRPMLCQFTEQTEGILLHWKEKGRMMFLFSVSLQALGMELPLGVCETLSCPLITRSPAGDCQREGGKCPSRVEAPSPSPLTSPQNPWQGSKGQRGIQSPAAS